MHLGDVANQSAAAHGKPLAGVRVLALEQMQSLPYATMMLSRLGADVVKIENPSTGDIGRGSQPSFPDPQGRSVGATFSRNNFNKRSICIDLKADEGRELVLRLVPHFDVVCENFRGGTVERLRLAFDDVKAAKPDLVYLSISGFGHGSGEPGSDWQSPYGTWPAYAAVAEAMSGLYEWSRRPDEPPQVSPMGAIGDIGSSLFAVIGVLAALRQRDRTGEAQYVDIAMFDSMLVFSDVVTNFASMGLRKLPGERMKQILDGFQASNGWFIVQVGRRYEFERLANLVGRPEWLDDPRFETAAGWAENIEEIRVAIETWSKDFTSVEASHMLAAAGIAAAPSFDADQVLADPHAAGRHMLVEMPRLDGGAPVVVPGNPVKISGMAEGPDQRVPWLGEHTEGVLGDELGLDEAELARLRSAGVIA